MWSKKPLKDTKSPEWLQNRGYMLKGQIEHHGTRENDLHMEVKSVDSLTSIYRVPESGSVQTETRAIDLMPEDKGNIPVREKPHEEDTSLSEKEQQRRMERLQETLKNHNVEISYNDEVNRYAIKVLDADSKEVVKEIPSEKTLEMFARMLEIEGLLVDEKR